MIKKVREAYGLNPLEFEVGESVIGNQLLDEILIMSGIEEFDVVCGYSKSEGQDSGLGKELFRFKRDSVNLIME